MFKERINAIQQYLKESNNDGYLAFISDDHGSEYIIPYYKEIAFLSGFTGSAGFLLITKEEAFLWTDGRYFLQAERQLKESGAKLKKMGIDESLVSFIASNLNSLVFDYKVSSVGFVDMLLKEKPSLKLVDNGDLINTIWKDRPTPSVNNLFRIPDRLISLSANQKCLLTLNRTHMKSDFSVLISDIADIAYLTNLRGLDIAYGTVFVSFMFLERKGKENIYTLYVDKRKLTNEIKDYLNSQSIHVKDYEDIYDDVRNTNVPVYYASSKTNYKLYSLMKNKKSATLWPTLAKAIKTSKEVKETKRIHVLDGLAMTKFIYYVKSNVGKIKLDEISLADKLEEFRRNEGAFELSFNTICGYQENGAIIHYSSTEETNVEVKDKGLLLVDSGGQYYYGTTDITRTLVLGTITDKQKEHFTLVLKGHIALANALFKKGKTDKELDKLARNPILEKGLDYMHGTGHGVGFCLNVHEGPQSISKFKKYPSVMKRGMITSNEPGLYFENEYGIRHENEILCINRGKKSLGFETITYVPFDLDGIDVSMLTSKEKVWLNDYHKMVYKKLASHLDKDERAFLRQATREI